LKEGRGYGTSDENSYLKVRDASVSFEGNRIGTQKIEFLRTTVNEAFGANECADWRLTNNNTCGFDVYRKATHDTLGSLYDGNVIEFKADGDINIPKAGGLFIDDEEVATIQDITDQTSPIDQTASQLVTLTNGHSTRLTTLEGAGYVTQTNLNSTLSTYALQSSLGTTNTTMGNIDTRLTTVENTGYVLASGLTGYYFATEGYVQTAVAGVSGGGDIINGVNAQFNLHGGGNVVFNSSQYLKWDTRIIAIPVKEPEYGSDGHINITCPASGTITYYNNSGTQTTVTCTSAGIPIYDWHALWYVVTPGQSQTSAQSKFVLTSYQSRTHTPDENWLLIASMNGDSHGNFLKYLPGQVTIPIGGGYTSAYGTLTSPTFSGTVTATTFSGNATTASTATTANGTNGASKIVVQNGTDGGSSKGIYIWTSTDTNWGIYMAQSGANKALDGGTAPAGNGFTSHAFRFRTYSADTQRGWIFEGNDNETKASIRSSDGHLYAKGYIQGAYNTDTTSYFGRTAIGFCGHDDWSSIAHIDRNNTNDYALLHNSSGLTLLNCASSESIRFRSGNTDRMYTRGDNGYLGIGTNSPDATLDVNGYVKCDGFYCNDYIGYFYSGLRVSGIETTTNYNPTNRMAYTRTGLDNDPDNTMFNMLFVLQTMSLIVIVA